jgi:hypothetical protein
MKTTRFDRRMLLRGMVGGAAVTIGLPTFDFMVDRHGTAFASGEPFPRRYGIWFWGNGVKADRFFPATTGTGWAVPPSLKPFADVGVIRKLSVVSRTWTQDKGDNAHWKNERPVFSSAIPILNGAGFPAQYGGPRIDSVVVKAFAGQAPIGKMDIGISRGISGAAALGGDIKSARYNPQAAFDRVFMNFTAPAAGSMPAPARPGPLAVGRASILDSVRTDGAALRKNLGTRDQARLDEHLAGIRELEQSLAALPPQVTSAACTPGTRPVPRADTGYKEPLQEINKAFADLLTIALACDRTRVFELNYIDVQGGTLLWQLGQTIDYHGFGHQEPAPQPRVQAAVEFIMKEFAYLAGKLDAVKVGAGTLLDQCLIWGTSEQNDPNGHGTFNVPTLLLGLAGGALKGGVHHQALAAGVSPSAAPSHPECLHSRVHYTALKALGLPNAYYGEGILRTSSAISELMS